MVDAMPTSPRILLVDDDEVLRSTLEAVLLMNGFIVATADGVITALQLIASQHFDILLTDMHMPHAADGLTVVSAMHHTSPETACYILSAFPDVDAAMVALLRQADGIMLKPMGIPALVTKLIDGLRLGAKPKRPLESVGDILANSTDLAIADWLQQVEAIPSVISIRLSTEERCGHLTEMFQDLVARLADPLPLGSRAHTSPAAVAHGIARRRQRYTAAMMVEESRMLQVCIFQTLQNNLERIDFSLLMVDIMQIADEVDSQLAQAMAAYVSESNADVLPMIA